MLNIADCQYHELHCIAKLAHLLNSQKKNYIIPMNICNHYNHFEEKEIQIRD